MKVFGQGKFHERTDPSIVFQSKTEGGEEETFSCLNCPSVEFALKTIQHFLLPKIHLKTELEHSEEFQHSMLVHKMGGVRTGEVLPEAFASFYVQKDTEQMGK